MANNLDIKDASATTKTVKTTDTASVHTPHHNVDTLPGTVETDIAAIKTAVEVIDNAISGSEMQVDVVTLPNVTIGAALPAGANAIGSVTVSSIPNVTVGAALPAGSNTIGTVGLAEKTIVFVTGTCSTSGDNTAIAAQGSGVKVVITGLWVQNESTSSTTIILKNGATAIARFLAVNRGDALVLPVPTAREWKMTANTAFVINLSAANSCGYTIAYYTE